MKNDELTIEQLTTSQRTQTMAQALFEVDTAGSTNKASWTEAQFMASLEAKSSIILTAKIADEYVGFVVASQQLFEVEIYLIVVREEFKNRAIGEQLLLTLKEVAQETNSEAIFLEVRTSNKPARRLYEKLAFEEIGIRRAYYNSPIEDAILMKLDL